MSKYYQLEQLRRMLENPMLQSGLYLIDTDLEDEEIESYIKEIDTCSYVTASLLPTKDCSAFDLFVWGLSFQCKSNEVRTKRNLYYAIERESREAIVYSLSILVVKELCANGKSVLHVRGDNDLNSLAHEDLWKLKDSLAHHNNSVLVISKCKQPNTNCDTNIRLLSFKNENKYRFMDNRLSKVYISYKHDTAYEKSMNAIKTGLTKNGIAFSIDEIDIKYRDNIEEYEKKIGKAERVIMFVTASYLKSIDCMFEMTRIFGNKNVKERVYPVVDMGPIPRNGDGLKQIEDYWKYEKDRKLDDMKGVANIGFLQGEIVKINDILKYINEFWGYLVHVNTGSYEQLTANDAVMLMEEIQKTSSIISAPIDDTTLPLGEKEPSNFRQVVQNGENSVYIENNVGSIIIKK